MRKLAAALIQAGYCAVNVDYPSRRDSIATLSDAAFDRTLGAPKL